MSGWGRGRGRKRGGGGGGRGGRIIVLPELVPWVHRFLQFIGLFTHDTEIFRIPSKNPARHVDEKQPPVIRFAAMVRERELQSSFLHRSLH